MTPILLSLGTNLGDRAKSLALAVDRLRTTFEVRAVSRNVESAAMYLEDQPNFLNNAVLAETSLGPRAVLTLLKGIEAEMGRQQRVRNGPREIDIDLIAYGALRYRYVEDGEAEIQVPHPRLAERAFVLKPIADIAPDFRIPGLGPARELLDNLGEAANAATWIDDAALSLHRR